MSYPLDDHPEKRNPIGKKSLTGQVREEHRPEPRPDKYHHESVDKQETILIFILSSVIGTLGSLFITVPYYGAIVLPSAPFLPQLFLPLAILISGIGTILVYARESGGHWQVFKREVEKWADVIIPIGIGIAVSLVAIIIFFFT